MKNNAELVTVAPINFSSIYPIQRLLNIEKGNNMESARDKLTRQIVEAEDLWKLNVVDPKGYECWGCGIDMAPRSWRKENKMRPNFSKYPNQSHAENCDADAEEKIIIQGIGKKQSIKDKLENTPGLSPSGLVLIEKREHVGDSVNPNSKKTSSSVNTNSKNQDLNHDLNKKSRRAANTIRPICRAFINFPYDRNMSLNVPGISGYNYMSIFKKIENNAIKKYNEKKIFYSPLQWNKIIHNDELLIIPLTAGIWTDNKPERTYKIHVDWSTWSKAKKTMLLNELEAAQDEAKQAKKENKKDKAWVFFIGEQDEDNDDIFYLKDQRLICSIVGHIIYPLRK